MKYVMILSVSLLMGCAQTVMVHPTKTSIDQDLYECQLESEQRTANWGAQGNIFLMKDWTQDCMEHRGWVVQR